VARVERRDQVAEGAARARLAQRAERRRLREVAGAREALGLARRERRGDAQDPLLLRVEPALELFV
jgi:hypothetical protein